MREWLWKLWCNYQYRCCMVDAYLADCRGDKFERGEWLCKALDWQREYLMAGRKLV